MFCACVAGAVGVVVSAQSNDVLPPTLSDVQILDVGTIEATVKWKTDEDADSTINYGLDKHYGIVRDPLPNKKSHNLLLSDLDPSTTYHFRIVSSDTAGNQVISGDFALTTKALQDIENIEKVEDTEQKALVEKAVAVIQKITDEKALQIVSDELKEQAKGVTSELTIIGTPTVKPDTTTAVVTWTTDRPSDSVVAFVKDKDFDATKENPYSFTQSSAEEKTQTHRIQIIGLDPSTKYHLQALSTDSLGIVGKSADVEFTTKSILPTIQNLRIVKVEETAATIAWRTSVPSGAVVEFQNLLTREKHSVGNPSLTVDHTIRLADLKLGTHYETVVIAENQAGDRVKSPPMRFVTIKDVEPPIISKVTNESTLFPDSDAKIQTIVSWETDELTQCDFYYHEGLASTEKDTILPRQDEGYNEKHVRVIIDFRPATVYKFWVICADSSANSARSEDFVLFTPQKEKSIIDIILENFQGTFGWVKTIGK
jgi:hypothetical protein